MCEQVDDSGGTNRTVIRSSTGRLIWALRYLTGQEKIDEEMRGTYCH